MTRLTVFIFIIGFLLLRPYVLQDNGLWYTNDDFDYFAHASAIVFGQFPSYQKEFFTVQSGGPQCPIGPGLLAAPFVLLFSLFDRLVQAPIVAQRTADSVPGSWSQFGFVFSSVFYFCASCFLLLRSLTVFFTDRYALQAVFFMILVQGMPLFVFRRPIFSHTAELFLQSLLIYLLIKNKDRLSEVRSWLWYSGIGFLTGMVFLTRPNNILYSFIWMGIFCFSVTPLLKDLKRWIGFAISLSAFVLLTAIFKIWPEQVNQYSSYNGIGQYLAEGFSWQECPSRLIHIFLGLDWGLIYTAPFLLVGVWALWKLDTPLSLAWKWLSIPIAASFLVCFLWGTQGGWYGYRYLISSALPVLIIPLAYLFQEVDQRFKKDLVWVWGLIALVPFFSMILFEGNYSTLNLTLQPVFFSHQGYTNTFYQLHVWEHILFHWDKFREAFIQGGVLYLYYISALMVSQLWSGINAFFPKYGAFCGNVFLKIIIIYSIPFLSLILFKKLFKEDTASAWSLNKSIVKLVGLLITACLFLAAGYCFIAVLYGVNIIFVDRTKDISVSQVGIEHLNQWMPREEDVHYLIKTQESGGKPFPRAVRQYQHYYRLIVEKFPDRDDAQILEAYCDYYLGNVKKAEESFLSVLKKQPLWFVAYYNLAVIYYYQGDFKQAMDMASLALKILPQEYLRLVFTSDKVMIPLVKGMPGAFEQKMNEHVMKSRAATLNILKASAYRLSGKINEDDVQWELQLF